VGALVEIGSSPPSAIDVDGDGDEGKKKGEEVDSHL